MELWLYQAERLEVFGKRQIDDQGSSANWRA